MSVKVTLTHNLLNMRIPEIRFPLHIPVPYLKLACHSRFGTQEDSMQLVLQDVNGNTICPLDDAKVLGYYSVEDEYIIHVTPFKSASTSTPTRSSRT